MRGLLLHEKNFGLFFDPSIIVNINPQKQNQPHKEGDGLIIWDAMTHPDR
jgi:hypothetical protein